MANLFRKPRSPYYWIQYRDPSNPKFDKHGKEVPRRESTGLRFGVGSDTRAARQLVVKRSLDELLSSGSKSDRWSLWVPGFLAIRYRLKPKSLLRYTTAWRTLSMFLEELKIERPRQLTRAHCFEYFTWRERPNPKLGKYRAGHNTTLLEIKLLGLLMKEAVIRNFAPANPARELDIHRAPAKKPCEFSEADLNEIATAIAKEPQETRTWLYRSFMIARYHGVRLSETVVDLSCVNLDEQTITFHQKGGKIRTKPLHPKLLTLFLDLKAAGEKTSLTPPKSFAKAWHNFFQRTGIKARLPNACFHSLRVTVENRLRRAGVEKALRMEYLSHDSKDVNSGYDRFTVEELKACHAAL